ncbi:GNAT family N-acetyltransferase [Longispora sp. K20-0274]|uniref:bifunctional acetate--CoA ligase family protein/GNAT family N-acetyltransferase n=1 Tax=Longispora sp. K20-0274 TaxID=3088255 RepID=UPI00399AA31A
MSGTEQDRLAAAPPWVDAADPDGRGYPAHRAADVLLADGGTVHLRPIRPSDGPELRRFHSRLSQRTRYYRYFSAYPRIPDRDLARFTTVDHHAREALVAVLGEDLIAVGRYDRLPPASDAGEAAGGPAPGPVDGPADGEAKARAEVAFVVEDAHQSRGIGSILLEHLAAAAREEGIEEFVAEVLPENGGMLRVFSDAGYSVDRSYADGVVHLVFDNAPTERSIRIARAREARTEAASISRLLTPRGVAVFGASTRVPGIGHTLLRSLRTGGYTGAIYPVHPRARTVQGLPAFRSVRDVPGPVDLAIVAVPASGVPGIVEDCAAVGVHGLVIVSSGFAETGAPEGIEAQLEIVREARLRGMRIIGPNCLGIANTDPDVRLNATLAPRLPEPGRVGFFCQSGALGVALLAEAGRRGLGLSSFVSAGNRADVSGNDLLQYWQADPHTDVVLLYLETFGNPRKFARLARGIGRDKPIIAVARPQSAAERWRHEVSGPNERGVEALFAQSGVLRVDTVAELFDTGLLLARQPLPAGDRIAIVGNTAALGLVAAQAAESAGLRVAAGYPLEVDVGAPGPELAAALTAANADPAVDAVVAVFVPPLVGSAAGYADVLVEGAGDKPVVAAFVAEGVLEKHAEGAVPHYHSVEAAVAALGRVARYAAWRRTPAELPEQPAAPAVAAGPGELLSAYQIRVLPARTARGGAGTLAAASELGYPVAVKIASAELRHRLDLGAVRLNLATPAEVSRAVAELAERFGPAEPLLVQPMAAPGIACVVEVVEDPSFGPIVGFGLAGLHTELLGDRAWRAAPLTRADAAELLRAPLASPLLFGHGGGPVVDIEALTDLLVRVGQLADATPALHRLELNPVIVGGSGVVALHASVELGTPEPRSDTGPRRM